MNGFDLTALQNLELSVTRKLDGLLQGDYRGLLPGHGSESGEARLYAPGDDVRHIDWAVTARTNEPHVRDTVADRELETVFVVDASGSMSFGSADLEKRDLALAAVGSFGFLVARGGNRIGALVLDGQAPRWIPARSGRRHLFGILGALQTQGRDGGAADLATGLQRAGRLARRRGLIVVVSDFLSDTAWAEALRGLGTRHELIAVEVIDPLDVELPAVGLLTVVDTETGRRRYVDTGRSSIRRRYAEAARLQREAIGAGIRAAGADHIRLRTDRDWVMNVARHVSTRRRRLAAIARPA